MKTGCTGYGALIASGSSAPTARAADKAPRSEGAPIADSNGSWPPNPGLNWLALAVRVVGLEKIAQAVNRSPSTVRKWLARRDLAGRPNVAAEHTVTIAKAAGIEWRLLHAGAYAA